MRPRENIREFRLIILTTIVLIYFVVPNRVFSRKYLCTFAALGALLVRSVVSSKSSFRSLCMSVGYGGAYQGNRAPSTAFPEGSGLSYVTRFFLGTVPQTFWLELRGTKQPAATHRCSTWDMDFGQCSQRFWLQVVGEEQSSKM